MTSYTIRVQVIELLNKNWRLMKNVHRKLCDIRYKRPSMRTIKIIVKFHQRLSMGDQRVEKHSCSVRSQQNIDLMCASAVEEP